MRAFHALVLLLAVPCLAASPREEAEARAAAALALSGQVKAPPGAAPCRFGCCKGGQCECQDDATVRCARAGCACGKAEEADGEKQAAVLTVYAPTGYDVFVDGEPAGVVKGGVLVLVSDPFPRDVQHTYRVTAGLPYQPDTRRTRYVTVRGGQRQTVDLRAGPAPRRGGDALAPPPVSFPAMPQMYAPPVMGGACGPRGG